MNKKQENLERLIRSLKQATPVLNDPNSLTNRIMDQIHMTKPQKTPAFLMWARAGLSTAAAVLIGLFILQQSEAENKTMTTSYKPTQEEKIAVDSTCMQLFDSKHLNIMKTYLCYMQQNSIENERFTTHPQQKTSNQ